MYFDIMELMYLGTIGHVIYVVVGWFPKAYVEVLDGWRMICMSYYFIFIIIILGINFGAKANIHWKGV